MIKASKEARVMAARTLQKYTGWTIRWHQVDAYDNGQSLAVRCDIGMMGLVEGVVFMDGEFLDKTFTQWPPVSNAW